MGEPLTKSSQIRTSNGYTLMAGISLARGEPHYLGIVPDEPNKLKKALSQLEDYDVFITTGDVSIGNRDYIKILVEEVGVKVHFHKIRIKPAKPILFGTYKEGKGSLVFLEILSPAL